MTRVDKIKEIRRLKIVQGLSIREVSRRLNLSRNTVRKILRNDAVQLTYQRTIENVPVTGPMLSRIEEWLKEDLTQKRKFRRTARRIYDILYAEHKYTGSYRSIARCVGEIRERINKGFKEAYIPLTYNPGDAFQFDWGEMPAYIDGQLETVHVGVVQLCYSRFFYPRVYSCQKQELFLDVHKRAFEFFGGVCNRGIYDNLKSAVKQVLKGHHPNLQEKFVTFCSYYLYEPEFCNPACGNEKGRVESVMKLIEQNFFSPIPHAKTKEELSERLLSFAISFCRNSEHPEVAGKTRYQLYEEEKNKLIQLPGYGFECCRTAVSVVSTYSTVFYDNNRYSVPAEYVGKSVLVKGYADEVVASYGGMEIARHKRVYGKKLQVLNPYHYLMVLYRKPRAFKDGLPFKNWNLPEVFLEYRKLLNEKYPEEGDVYFAKTLILLKDWPVAEVANAISKAIIRKILGDSYILTMLKHSNGPPPENTDMLVRADLAQYSAKQRPPGDYDRILRGQNFLEEKINERK